MREKIIDLLYAENVRSDCGIERLADEICAIDAVEVVRCGECKYHMDIDDGRQKHRMCAELCCDDWFCADGERREG